MTAVTPGSAELLALAEKYEREVDAAIESLTNHQVQCDMDGVMVEVSRLALDQVLAYLSAIRALAAKPAPQNRDDLLALKSRLALASPKFRVGGDTVEISVADWNACRLLVDGALAGERAAVGVVLLNQIEIMSAVSLLLRYAQPDLIGKAGELDRQRDDLFQRHKATQAALSPTGAPKP